MATPIRDLVYQIRSNIKEPIPSYWNDVEILFYLNNGARDLWRKIINIYEEHFVRVSDAPWLKAGISQLYQVPDDVFRVLSIEPRILGESSPNQGLIFKPRRWVHPDFVMARAMADSEPNNNIIYWTQFAAGAPVGPPTIRIAPKVTSDVNLTITYNPTVPVFDETDSNPIPGESDQALIAWGTAYALAKQTGAGPDPYWIGVYATEKGNIASEMPPRQIQEPEYVEGMFEGYEF